MDTRELLEQIRFENEGRLTPQDVVETASEPSHPLHEHFNWDDSEAAHNYRLWQARVLIRSVKVIINDKPVPAFVNVKVDSIQYYQRADVVVNNSDEWASALNLAQQRLAVAERDLINLQSIAKPVHSQRVLKAVRHAGQARQLLQAAAA